MKRIESYEQRLKEKDVQIANLVKDSQYCRAWMEEKDLQIQILQNVSKRTEKFCMEQLEVRTKQVDALLRERKIDQKQDKKKLGFTSEPTEVCQLVWDFNLVCVKFR